MPRSKPAVIQQIVRHPENRLDVLIVGAGLGGLGAAISIALAGHRVHLLEATSEIGEIGAGIQVLPNSSRVLFSWGMEKQLAKHATQPKLCNYLNWKGEKLAHMDFHEYAHELGTPFWDFHRSNLHSELLNRSIELGATIETNAKVRDIEYECQSEERTIAVAVLENGSRRKADLIVGADGIHSRCREILLGRPDPPVLTGDLAYRLLLDTKEMMKDPELRTFIENPQVNYWMGPDAHVVNYVLRDGELFNMVLLVPDDIPAGVDIVAGNISEMCALFADWDPRIRKALALCSSVHKWRLCIRPNLHPTWSHENGSFTILGDAAHATLPYLASGAGMSLEDAHVLGLCLGRLSGKSDAEKNRALNVYERCRRDRTERVVARGSIQQHLYHIYDGPEQQDRDRLLREFSELKSKVPVSQEILAQKGLQDESDPFPWRWHGVGKWLLPYQCDMDVQLRWSELQNEEANKCCDSKNGFSRNLTAKAHL